ncbi:outer membrane protein assembly factor BamA [Simiduia sp. 21SJ11W-1]|uniref:outer membrane protein assembly factor BamA n=1 Tax=Simiduia sp. 21SJ11W-1 TaxID=2909669 RepID=UPI00209FA370|nr:outer membrane protein assembly factor BamA [Simiduia sp. 21SJ11W-1]UTA46743.1 outer membrane protein assembly factor BamA [Simiduia sp. 21SJ11W-1]
MQRLVLLIASLVFTSAVYAESFRVTDIRVEGLQRVSAGSVFAALPVRIGDFMDTVEIQDATRSLFATGHFADIEIGRDEGVLVITVKERPAISEIVLEGNKAIKTEDLMKGLRENGLSEGQIFKRVTLEGLGQELQRQYVAQGRYSASVKTEVIDLPRNQVKLQITIDEGKVASIEHINLVGNHAFSDEELLELFELKTTGWLSWITSDNKYAREKLTGDIERLESHYMDRGYLKFRMPSTQVSVSPDKESVYITINIEEGEVYKIGKVDLAGDPILPEAYIRRLILVREGETFSQVLMTTTSDYITKRLGNEGYTFAEVRGIPELNAETGLVDVTFFIDPGKRAYVRRVEFRGNTKTKDEVLRREMRQMEGASAKNSDIEYSKLKLERLGFFKEVQVETNEVPGTADLVDVEYTVEEQPSGSIGASVGYAQGTGLVLGANIQQNNWMGSGKRVGISVNTSKYQQVYSFNYMDPYFTVDGVSRGFSVFYRATDFSQINIASYSTNTYGANLNFGYPISEVERIGFGIGYTNMFIKTGRSAVQEIKRSPNLIEGIDSNFITESDLQTLIDEVNAANTNPISGGAPALDFSSPIDEVVNTLNNPEGFIDANGDRFDSFPFTLSWAKSTLNRGQLATRGSSHNLSLEFSVPGSDMEFYKLRYSGQYFQPIYGDFTLRFRGDLGYADSYGKTSILPFFEHFYAGGFGSVRGFKRNTLGPRSTPAATYDVVGPYFGAQGPGVGAEDTDGDGRYDTFQGGYILCDQTRDVIYKQGADVCIQDKLRASVIGRDDLPFGGNVLIEGSVELLFPLPFIEDQRMLQAAFFVDAGNVFNTQCGFYQQNCFDVDMSRMSASYGLGLTWISGFGPLTFSLSQPFQYNPEDERETFQFSLGTAF